MKDTELQYMLAGLLGAVVAVCAANRIWYPAPTIHGVALGLLMAVIVMLGAAGGASAWYLARRL